jgi:hypothetical protein
MKDLLRILFQVRIQHWHQFWILARAHIEFEQVLKFGLRFSIIVSSKARHIATKDERGNLTFNTKHCGGSLLVDLVNELANFRCVSELANKTTG